MSGEAAPSMSEASAVKPPALPPWKKGEHEARGSSGHQDPTDYVEVDPFDVGMNGEAENCPDDDEEQRAGDGHRVLRCPELLPLKPGGDL